MSPGERVAVVGAGSIGSYLALRLLEAGHEVTVCTRSPLERLVVESGDESRELDVAVLTEPERAEPADWVFLALKAQDTPAAAAWLARLARPTTTLVVAQNGVEHRERVADMAGAVGAVLPALIYANVERLGPSHFRHRAGDQLVVPDDPAAAALAELLSGSVLAVQADPEFATASWRKLLSNISANPLTALTLGRLRILQDDDGIKWLARELMSEAIPVAVAEGALLSQDDVEAIMDAFQTYPGGGGTSMLFDRLSGRPMEHEALTGAVVRAAERHVIPVPLNAAVLALLRALDRAPAPAQGAGPA